MIHKTNALVLRVTPFSETSQVVTWLTREYGKIVVMVKGALRRDSPFLGQYDLFYTSELLFHERKAGAMHIARECAVIKPRKEFRRCWQATACASYLADLLYNWLPLQIVQPDLFELLECTLDNLADKPDETNIVPWFELSLLDLAGMAPELRACVACRKPTQDSFNKKLTRRSHQADSTDYSRDGDNTGRTAYSGGRWIFSPERGGLMCGNCLAGGTVKDDKAVTLDVLGILGFWQKSGSWQAARRMRCHPRQAVAIFDLLGVFITRHLEIVDRSRRVMFEIINPSTC